MPSPRVDLPKLVQFTLGPSLRQSHRQNLATGDKLNGTYECKRIKKLRFDARKDTQLAYRHEVYTSRKGLNSKVLGLQ